MNLSALLATWQTWNERNVLEQALGRAKADGRDDDADQLRHTLAQVEEPPPAVEALAAQHELAELLGGWRWHTVTAAREQGATWSDVAAATGTDPSAARDAYLEQVAAAEHAAEAYGIPFRDAERYRAAARDDTDTPTRTDVGVETAEETPAMTDHQPTDRDDLRVDHISGPDQLDDGLVVGEIALPGGLPPDEDDEDDEQRWEEAFEIADRDGYVVFDPTTASGFRPLSTDERSQLLEAAEPTGDDGETHEESYWQSEEGRARIGQWAVENADPAKAIDDSHPDDPDELEQRLEDLRVRLTGYTWREGVDRDEAIADRREELGRWYTDDHAEHDGADEDVDEEPVPAQLECGPDVGKTP